MPMGKHTYIRQSATRYAVGFLMVQRTDGVQSFVPLLDVATMREAIIAVNALNGGEPMQGVTITHDYSAFSKPA